MLEEVHRKRMEAEEERRRAEAVEREKQRLREREEREAEKERELEQKKKREQQIREEEQSSQKPDDSSVVLMLRHWQQQLDQKRAARDVKAAAAPASSQLLNTTFTKGILSPVATKSPSSHAPSSSAVTLAPVNHLLDTTFSVPKHASSTIAATVSTAPISVTASSSSASHLVTTPTQQSKSAFANSRYAEVNSYELTPANQDPINEADNNYNIADISSDDSTDDEDAPKKKVPLWAAPAALTRTMQEQESYVRKHAYITDNLFPPEELLMSPDLSVIFNKKRKRFYQRSSSAHWTSPLIKRKRASTNMSD